MATYREELMNNILKRKETLLKGSKISLAVEERFTNLIIWIGKKEDAIYMRLDKANNYSVPFKKERLDYLNKEHKTLKELLEFFVFGETSVSEIDKVLEITKDMKYRECVSW